MSGAVPKRGDVTRRHVLQAAGAGIAAASLGGCDLLGTEPAGEPDDDGRPANKAREAPMLADLVQAGELPPVEERLPTEPLVIEPTDSVGVYGGTWNSWVQGLGALYMVVVEVGYETLVRWDPEWTDVIPNVAKSWEVTADGREYVFHLHEGIK